MVYQVRTPGFVPSGSSYCLLQPSPRPRPRPRNASQSSLYLTILISLTIFTSLVILISPHPRCRPLCSDLSHSLLPTATHSHSPCLPPPDCYPLQSLHNHSLLLAISSHHEASLTVRYHFASLWFFAIALAITHGRDPKCRTPHNRSHSTPPLSGPL